MCTSIHLLMSPAHMLLWTEAVGFFTDEHYHEAKSHDSIYVERNGNDLCLYGAGKWSGAI